MWGWLAAIVKGAVGAFFQWYATYDEGRKAQQLADAKTALDAQQQVDQAVHDTVARHVDRDWLQRGSDPRPAASQPPADHPPAPDRPTER